MPGWSRTAVALAALVVPLGVGAGGQPAAQPSASVVTGPAPRAAASSSAQPGVTGAHRALAQAAARRAFRHFPVPGGSTKLHAAPRRAPFLRRLSAQVGEVDSSLTRTGWWRVPMSYGRVVAWYVARTGADPRSTYYPDETSPAPKAELDWATGAATTAYSRPVDVLAYQRLGPHLTAIRDDVTLAARADRTAETLAPATGVSSMDVTTQAIDGPDTSPSTATVADPADVAAAVTAFNGLEGAYVSTGPHGCGSPVGISHVYAVTFHWPDHTLAVDPGAALCGVGRGLTLDGVKLPETLQNDRALDRALAAAGS